MTLTMKRLNNYIKETTVNDRGRLSTEIDDLEQQLIILRDIFRRKPNRDK